MARQKNPKKKVAVGRPNARQVMSSTSVKSDVLRESLADAMKPLLTFAEVLKQTESPHVLLGNGFSMAYDRKRFSFTTLLESATKEGIIDAKSELYKVFQYALLLRSCVSGRSVYIFRIASRSLRGSGSRMCGVVLRARLFRQGIPRRGIATAAVCMVQTETGTALCSSPAREQQFRSDPFLLG
jgi:hypothetical protein